MILTLPADQIMSDDSSSSEKVRIWELPGLHKDEFYTAAYFIQKVQRQQDPEENY